MTKERALELLASEELYTKLLMDNYGLEGMVKYIQQLAREALNDADREVEE